ncbi:MAG: cadherin-like domain-containing protein [Brevefilum sp.]|nr:cadherin-like domain-containing protein [Brevefilum sp.]
MQLPWDQVELNTVTYADTKYISVDLPEWEKTSQPGYPELPYTTKLFGVPFDVEISLEVRSGEVRQYNLLAPVFPTPDLITNWPLNRLENQDSLMPEFTNVVEKEPQVYLGGNVYPGELAKIINDGILRGQRIISVAVFPIQYEPSSNLLIIYKNLEVFISFSDDAFLLRSQPSSDSYVYESLFQEMLVNYEEARQWRQKESALPSTTTSPDSFDARISNFSAQEWIPPSPSWRVVVREQGIHHITYDELLAAGILVGSPDPANFKMYYQGVEIPIEIRGGAGGVFNSGDRIVFFGESINNKYTKDNVYWLTVGSSPGLRMTSRAGTPTGADTPSHYQADIHFEENKSHWSLMPGSDDLERFYWQLIASQSAGSPSSWEHHFTLPTPVLDLPGSITVAMIGYTSYAAIQPDHHVIVHLNGQLLGETKWDGRTWKMLTLDIPGGILNTGNNTLRLTLPNDTGAAEDTILVDWINLTYNNQFFAQNNLFSFKYDSGTWQYVVNGFSTNQISVYDVTNPIAPVIVDGAQISASSPFSLTFKDTISARKNYQVVGQTAFKSVLSIQAGNNAANLYDKTQGADYIIISHSAFLSQAEALRAFRASQGLHTVLVDIQDVYDFFSFGVADASAIHDFLAYTYDNWQPPAPSYVLLVGDGHYDPKDYLNYGRTSYIPPYLAMADPKLGETAADNRYVTLDGANRMPDMMLGRLPVNSAAEADIMVNKIINYETASPADWNARFLAVADKADSAGDFPTISDNIITRYLPDHYTLSRAYFGLSPTTTPVLTKQAIIDAINTGSLFVNYFGHAGDTFWSEQNIFSTADLISLNNSTQLPVVLAMTCLEGFFHNPDPEPAFAVAMTRAADKGSIANWSPSGVGVATGHSFLNHGFLWSFFQRGSLTLGEPIISGKLHLWASGSAQDLLDTYHLFGDPALRVRRILTGIPDSYETTENMNLSVIAPGVLTNDINPTDADWSVSLVQNASNGTVALAANGGFTYNPEPGFSGVDQFFYQISAGGVVSNTTQVRITVNGENSSPTDIFLSNDNVAENMPSYTVVGIFSTEDPDIGDTFFYSLVPGIGDTHNHFYNISGDRLRTLYTFNYEARQEHYIRVRSTDSGGLYFEKSFTISILDVNEPPYFSELSNSTVLEKEPVGTEVGLFSTRDEDLYDDHTYSLIDPDNYPDNSAFTIMGNRLLTKMVFYYASQSTYTINVRTTDSGGLYTDDEFTITVIPTNQPPVVSVIPDQTIYKGQSFATINLDSYVSDPDNTADQMTWTYSGITELAVSIDTNRVATITVPNPDWTGSENITFRATDPGGLWDEDTATFTVTSKLIADVQLSKLIQTYDGQPKPVTVITTPEGLSVTVTYNGSTTVPTNAGSYAVVATVVEPNYQGSASDTLVIAKATATVSLGSLNHTYDGNPKTASVTTSPSGLSVTVTYDESTTTPTNAGSYPVVATVVDPNHQGSANGNLIIHPRPITVTADNKTKPAGEPDPSFTYQITDGELVSTDQFSGSLTREEGEAVGFYDILQGTLSLSVNYLLDFIPGTLTITHKPIIVVTVDAHSKVYGDEDPTEFTFTYTPDDPQMNFTGALSRIAGEDVGLYTYTLNTLSAGDAYTIDLVSAYFSITPRPITVTADNRTKFVGDPDPELTYQITDGELVLGDVLSGPLERDPGESIGTYPIRKGSLSAGSNYDLSFINGVFTITIGSGFNIFLPLILK